ncbi:MAG: hypothetical protein ACRDJ4_07295 [Actinomycetota bacterium]
MGPIIIFDKSALQGLSLDEAVWLEKFFLTNITPLFYVETLADLEKPPQKGRSPEDVISDLASKTPVLGANPNVFHHTLVVNDLLGNRIDMSNRPVLGRGETKRSPDGRVGVHFKDSPEHEALRRWNQGEFSEIERQSARVWRALLSGVDFAYMIDWAKRLVPPGRKLATLHEAKEFADSFVNQASKEVVSFAQQFLNVPEDVRAAVSARYAADGCPSLSTFAPYAAFVLKVDLVFYLGTAISQISSERPSNKIDVNYLYYLPFCMAFTSADRLHERLAPMFMESGQVFVRAADLKASLKQLDGHFARYREEIERVGLISFAPYPPQEIENEVSLLWDRFLPAWRQHATDRERPHEPADSEMARRIVEISESPVHVPAQETEGDPDFVLFTKRVPVRKGSWRLMPEGIEAQTERRVHGS